MTRRHAHRLLPRLRREEGISALELGLVLPVLLVIFALTVPLVKAGFEYITLSRATAHGVRFATRVDPNARSSADGLTRRPTADEVGAFVRDAAGGLVLDEVTVTPEPTSALPGDVVTVRVSYEVSFGPLATLANAITRDLLRSGEYLPQSKVVTVTATGREE